MKNRTVEGGFGAYPCAVPATAVVPLCPAILDADTHGFAMFPNRLLLAASVPAIEKLTYMLLVHFARRDGRTFVSQERLAKHVGVKGRARIGKALKFLARERLITAEPQKRGRATVWVLNQAVGANLSPGKVDAGAAIAAGTGATPVEELF